jgi:HK97 family phage major capsid protein
MANLEANDIQHWDRGRVERELRERRDDVAAIRERNGSTLVGLTGDDADRVTEHMQSLNLLGERFDELRAQEQGDEQFTRLTSFLSDPDPEHAHPGHGGNGGDGRQAAQQRPRDIGGLFLESEAFAAYVDRGAKDVSAALPTAALFGRGGMGIGEIPAAGMNATLFDSTGFGSRPDYRDDQLVPVLYQPNNISDLMPQGSTDSDSIIYPVETVTATGAAEVAEGNSKPEAQLSFADTTEPVQTIAVLLPVTNKALRNRPFLRAYLNARLRLFVQNREDSQLLNGNGTSPNLKGILNRSGINTATSYSIGGSNPDQALIDGIFKASMRVRDAFVEPDAVVVKPSTWEIAALAKDSQRNYLLGSEVASWINGSVTAAPRIWGLRVVLNANMPAQSSNNKVALVGSFSTSAMVIRRDQLNLAISDSHSTFFAENKLMIRAEEEVALAVFRPAAFAAVTSAA